VSGIDDKKKLMADIQRALAGRPYRSRIAPCSKTAMAKRQQMMQSINAMSHRSSADFE
jgi:hypothetical protein